jgi:hypothetical protein
MLYITLALQVILSGAEIQDWQILFFMKAIRLHELGGAEKLMWEEAPMPVLRQDYSSSTRCDRYPS